MLLCDAFLSRLVLAVQPCFEVYLHINKNIKYLLWELCVVCRHFAISQETLPRIPGRFVFTTTKNYGSLPDTSLAIYEAKIWFCEILAKYKREPFGMFCASRAVRIFGRRGRSVALRTSICELHSQVQRRTVLLWYAR